jgi:N-acetylmuramoyl-L-alanine amidase CwlA
MKSNSLAVSYFNDIIEAYLEVKRTDTVDKFINLPKEKTSYEEDKALNDYAKSLTKKEQQKFWSAKYKDDYITQRVRDFMSELIPQKKAQQMAENDYNEVLKAYKRKKESQPKKAEA